MSVNHRLEAIDRLLSKIPVRPAPARATQMNSWMVVGVNNDLLPSGLSGVKYIAAALATTVIDYSNLNVALTNPTDTGIGICRNVLSDALRIFTTFGSPYSCDAVNGSVIALTDTILPLVNGLVTYRVYKYYARF